MTAVGRTVGRGVTATGRGLAGRVNAADANPRVGLRARLVVGLALAALVLAAGVGALYHQVQRAQAVEQARTAAVGAAKSHVANLLSYNYKNLGQDLAQAKALTTGRFQSKYVRLSSGVVAPSAKKQQLVTRTRVVSASVVSAEPQQVVALLFVNQATTSKKIESPKVDRSRVRATMTKVDGRWLVSGLEPV